MLWLAYHSTDLQRRKLRSAQKRAANTPIYHLVKEKRNEEIRKESAEENAIQETNAAYERMLI
jgi:heat shock protein HspQ